MTYIGRYKASHKHPYQFFVLYQEQCYRAKDAELKKKLLNVMLSTESCVQVKAHTSVYDLVIVNNNTHWP